MPPEGQPETWAVINAVARHFGKVIDNGSRAELRRMDPGGSLAEPALHRLLAEHVPETWLFGERLRRWALIAHIAAILGPDLSSSQERLGKSLSDCGIKEGRLTAFLQARGDQLLVMAPRMARLAVAKGVGLKLIELGEYLLDEVRDDARAERCRVRIAQAFYRAEQRKQSKAA
jgi:CRISPR type I-E-associated protein CasB/Cse2